MQEIGSEFWEVPVSTSNNNLFPSSTQWFLCGRSALQAIIKDLNDCHTVALPSWCCHTMIKPFVDAELEVRFYPVYFDRGLHQKLRFDCDVLLLIDYFGYSSFLDLPDLPNLGDYKGTIIRDVTHSIFSASYSDADYYFGSLRKWCGFWTGGFAWTSNGHVINNRLTDEQADNLIDDLTSKQTKQTNEQTDTKIDDNNTKPKRYSSLREKAMLQKEEYIIGKQNERTDKGYLKIFEEAEKIIENIGIAPATDRDIAFAKHLDIKTIRSKRIKNAEVLINAFQDWLIFPEKLHASDCPLFVPVLVPNNKRNELRKYLIQHKIYCPIHWPVSEYHTSHINHANQSDLSDLKDHNYHGVQDYCEYTLATNKETENIYTNELSLVCDQRYNEEDMDRIVETIHRFLTEI